MRHLLLLLLGALAVAACSFDPPGLCTADAECPEGTSCVNGVCSGCDADTDCDIGLLCGEDHRCVPPAACEAHHCGCFHTRGGCDPHASCALGGTVVTCTCNEGYGGDGRTCLLLKKCEPACGENETCQATPETAECVCAKGYHRDGAACVDIDECAAGTPCAPGTCANTVGSYECTCPAGYVAANGACEDVDECATDNGGCGAAPANACTNKVGTFECGCGKGFALTNGVCTDVDECAEAGICKTLQCRNTPGSYVCECGPGQVVVNERCEFTDGRILWSPQGVVNALALAGTRAFVGGRFKKVGPATGAFAVLDLGTMDVRGGVRLQALPIVKDLAPNVIIGDEHGGWFLGGYSGVLHVGADGAVDTSFEFHHGPVGALLLYSGRLFIGSSKLEVVDATAGTLVSGYDDIEGAVNSLQRIGTTLFVGGKYRLNSGTRTSSMFALNLTSKHLMTWSINDKLLEGGAVVVGGKLVVLDPHRVVVSPSLFRAIDPVSGSVIVWSSVTARAYELLAQENGTLFAAVLNAGASHDLIALTAGNAPVRWVRSLPSLAYEPGVVAGSGRIFIPGQPLKVLDSATGASLDDIDTNGRTVETLGVAGARLALYGSSLESLMGTERQNVAAVDLATGKATAFAPRIDPTATDIDVRNIAVAGDVVYVDGWKRSAGFISRLDANTGATLPWIELGSDYSLPWLLEATPSEVFLGTGTGSSAQLRVFRNDGSTTPSWSVTSAPDIRSVAAQGDVVYVAGAFSTIAGQPRRGLAAFDRQTGALLPFAPSGPSLSYLDRIGPIFATESVVAALVTSYASGPNATRLVRFDATTGAELWAKPAGLADMVAVDDWIIGRTLNTLSAATYGQWPEPSWTSSSLRVSLFDADRRHILLTQDYYFGGFSSLSPLHLYGP